MAPKLPIHRLLNSSRILTATSDFLKSQTGIRHLVLSQKQLRESAQGTNPREMAGSLQKVGSPLRPPVLTVSCPQEREAVGMPLLSTAFIAAAEKQLSRADRSGFQGFLCL